VFLVAQVEDPVRPDVARILNVPFGYSVWMPLRRSRRPGYAGENVENILLKAHPGGRLFDVKKAETGIIHIDDRQDAP